MRQKFFYSLVTCISKSFYYKYKNVNGKILFIRLGRMPIKKTTSSSDKKTTTKKATTKKKATAATTKKKNISKPQIIHEVKK